MAFLERILGTTAMSTADAPASSGGVESGSSAPPESASAGASGESAPATAEGSSAEATSAAAAPQAPAPKAEPAPRPAKDWRDDRIAKQSAQLHRERTEKAALMARLQAMESQGGQPQGINPATGKTYTQAEFQAAVREATAAAAFNARCDAAAQDGKARFSDFDDKLASLRSVLDPGSEQDVKTWYNFLEAALETGDAPRVIHALGSDLNEASRVLSLSPAKRAVELAKMVLEPGAPEPSKAPKPIKPVGTKSAGQNIKPDDPEVGHTLSMDEWMRRREADIAEKRRARA